VSPGAELAPTTLLAGFTLPGAAGRHGYLQSKMDRQWPLGPVNLAEVQLRPNETHLVTDPVPHERRLGVVQDDALLVVVPARALVHLGSDRVDPERRDPVLQGPLLRVEDFALPGEEPEALGDLLGADRAGRDEGGPVRRAAGDLPGRALREQ